MSNTRTNEKNNAVIVRHDSADKIRREPKDPLYYHPIALFGKKKAKHPNAYNGITDPLIRDTLPEEETINENKKSP